MKYVKKYKFINLFIRPFVLSFLFPYLKLVFLVIPYLKRFNTVLVRNPVGFIPKKYSVVHTSLTLFISLLQCVERERERERGREGERAISSNFDQF